MQKWDTCASFWIELNQDKLIGFPPQLSFRVIHDPGIKEIILFYDTDESAKAIPRFGRERWKIVMGVSSDALIMQSTLNDPSIRMGVE